ncbi:MAG: hypothetical protein WA960_22605 [Tunicatimonas sp.]
MLVSRRVGRWLVGVAMVLAITSLYQGLRVARRRSLVQRLTHGAGRLGAGLLLR